MIKPKVLLLCTGNSRRTHPGAIWRLQWDLEDPSKAVTREERCAALRRVRDDIQQRVAAFVKEHA